MSPRIIFVCTGNVFRSLSAEYSAKKHAPGLAIGSAGIVAAPERIPPMILDELERLGIDARRHQQRRTTRELLAGYDLVVAMGIDHKEYLKAELGLESTLFNQLYQGREESVLDVWEAIPDYRVRPRAAEEYIRRTVRYVHDAIPAVLESSERALSSR